MDTKPMRWIDAAANIDEHFHGPLPDSDIVATQGKYLKPYPDTPTDASKVDVTRLHNKLDFLLVVQKWRRRKYGSEVAEEWPISHTPPEVTEEYEEREKKVLEAPTPSDDGSTSASDFYLGRSICAEEGSSPPTDCDKHCTPSEPTLPTPPSSEERTPPSEKPSTQPHIFRSSHGTQPRLSPPKFISSTSPGPNFMDFSDFFMAAPSTTSIARPADCSGGAASKNLKKKRKLSDFDAELDQGIPKAVHTAETASTKLKRRKIHSEVDAQLGEGFSTAFHSTETATTKTKRKRDQSEVGMESAQAELPKGKRVRFDDKTKAGEDMSTAVQCVETLSAKLKRKRDRSEVVTELVPVDLPKKKRRCFETSIGLGQDLPTSIDGVKIASFKSKRKRKVVGADADVESAQGVSMSAHDGKTASIETSRKRVHSEVNPKPERMVLASGSAQGVLRRSQRIQERNKQNKMQELESERLRQKQSSKPTWSLPKRKCRSQFG